MVPPINLSANCGLFFYLLINTFILFPSFLYLITLFLDHHNVFSLHVAGIMLSDIRASRTFLFSNDVEPFCYSLFPVDGASLLFRNNFLKNWGSCIIANKSSAIVHCSFQNKQQCFSTFSIPKCPFKLKCPRNPFRHSICSGRIFTAHQ